MPGVSSPRFPMPGMGGSQPSGQLPPPSPYGRPSGQLPVPPQGRPSGQLPPPLAYGRPSGQLPVPPQANGYSPGLSQPLPSMPGGYSQQRVQVAERPPMRARRGRPALLIIGLLVLVALVLGGGWFGYSQFAAQQGTAAPPQPTAAATFVPKLPAVFADSFKDNGKGWNVQSAPGKFSAKVGNGALILEDDEHHLLWEAVPSKEKSAIKPYGDFGDFKMLVDVQLSKGDQNNSYGIFFRGSLNQNSELATYYRFAVYSDGSYAAFKGNVDANGKFSTPPLVAYKKNPVVKAGNEINHLMITAKGANMVFSINGQALETVNDTSYKNGIIALFVSNLKEAQGGAQATFTNLAIYPADA